jgi:hypothetical protein
MDYTKDPNDRRRVDAETQRRRDSQDLVLVGTVRVVAEVLVEGQRERTQFGERAADCATSSTRPSRTPAARASSTASIIAAKPA